MASEHLALVAELAGAVPLVLVYGVADDRGRAEDSGPEGDGAVGGAAEGLAKADIARHPLETGSVMKAVLV